MSGNDHSQDRIRNGGSIPVGTVVSILLLSGCVEPDRYIDHRGSTG
jgi:hypothetical protein